MASVRLEPGRVESWRPDALAIDPWTVLRLARYRRRDEVPAPVAAAARAAARLAEALATPGARVRRVRVAAAAGAATLEGGAAFSGSAVARHLAGAPEAVAFVLTLGPALEEKVSALGSRGEPLEAYLLDLAGWAGLEAAVRRLREALRSALPEARLSHRLGPGHQDWPIEEQRRLVALLDGPGPPIRLSEFGVLVPFKSVSGLFAIRPAGPG